jgi:hypothetical protein
MNKKKPGKRRKIYLCLLVIALIALLAGGFAWFKFSETRPELSHAKADESVTAANLNNAFSLDESAANKKYLNKIVEVKGVVALSKQQGNSAIIELEGPSNGIGGVNCEMRNLSRLPQKGETITIKGRCTGYLMDVNMVDGVLTK